MSPEVVNSRSTLSSDESGESITIFHGFPVAPSGRPLVYTRVDSGEADLAWRVRSQKSLSIVTESAGDYEIRLAPSNHAPLERRFELKIGGRSDATDVDRLRAAAEKSLGAGEQERRRMQPDARRSA